LLAALKVDHKRRDDVMSKFVLAIALSFIVWSIIADFNSGIGYDALNNVVLISIALLVVAIYLKIREK
jgi:hypothetical protein